MTSNLGLHCLPLFHKKGARLIWIKTLKMSPFHNLMRYVRCRDLMAISVASREDLIYGIHIHNCLFPIMRHS